MRSNDKTSGEQALLISQVNMIRLSFCVAAMCALLLLSAKSQGADSSIKPSIALSEEVTDNIGETSGNKSTEYITHISPGFTSVYTGPYWNWDATYTFNYINYARKSNPNEYTHLASLKGNISVVENFLYLDVSDTYQRVSIDVARDPATQTSSYLNQTDQNIATVAPYLLWRLGEKSTLKTGYRYTDTRYWGEGIEKQEHSAFDDFSRELTSRLSLSAGYSFTLSESLFEQYNTHNVYGGFNYQYADKSSIHATIGNNWQKFSSGKNTTTYSWNIGIVHDFDIVVATLETSSQTITDPKAVSTTLTSYSGKLDKVLQRGNIGLSTTYSKFANSETGINNQRKMSYSLYGRYEVIPDLNTNLAVTAERSYMNTNTNTASDFPYQLSVTTGLGYAFNHDLSLNLNYTYYTKRNDLDDATGAVDINRVILEVKKVF